MLENIFRFTLTENQLIEKLIDDSNLQLNHMVLSEGGGLPEHYSNSNVYLLIIKGCMSLILEEQEPHFYCAGQIIRIPYHTKMNIKNNKDRLEFFVVKAPSPASFGGQ
jgi:hypothetical protein